MELFLGEQPLGVSIKCSNPLQDLLILSSSFFIHTLKLVNLGHYIDMRFSSLSALIFVLVTVGPDSLSLAR